MKIAIFGTGYVGLVSGVCLAEVGHDVICVDIDEKKIEMLKKGIAPIYEDGLETLLQKQLKNKSIIFTTDGEDAISRCQVIFSAVGTPPKDDGSADLQFVEEIARLVGKHMNDYKVIVTKSTVPPLTGILVENIIAEELAKRKLDIEFDVASNPEFLKEGTAVEDFMHPDRIVVGVNSKKAGDLMRKVYEPYVRNGHKLFVMDRKSAEIVKYAANAMLATRIAFMNEISQIADKIGANINAIKDGIGSDSRIGDKFLNAGPGFGGSCFPKDVKAISSFAQEQDLDMNLLSSIEESNRGQKLFTLNKILDAFGNSVKEKKIAVWGLAFKAGTDDVRETPAEVIITGLINAGACIHAYDPVAQETFQMHTKIGKNKNVKYFSQLEETLSGADGVVIMTEWEEFKNIDLQDVMDAMNGNVFCDMRNLYQSYKQLPEGLQYYNIGSNSLLDR